MPEHTFTLILPQYRARGSFLYHGQPIEYAGFLYLHENNEEFKGNIVDGRVDCPALFCEGTLKHQNSKIILEFTRQAVQSRFPQSTLSDPMIFTLSKEDNDGLAGTYEGTWKFAERCFNVKIGIDEHGEKAPIFHDDTNTTGKVNLTLEEIL